MEIWKDIPDYEGFYQASNLGKIKRLVIKKKTIEKLLVQVIDKYGYCKLNLCKNGVAKRYLVHRLVLSAFIGKDPKQVDHINGIKTDNSLVNLEYVSNRENQLRCKERIGAKSKLRGVSWHKQNKKWQSEIRIDNKRVYLGTFNTEQEANEAYLKRLSTIKNDK